MSTGDLAQPDVSPCTLRIGYQYAKICCIVSSLWTKLSTIYPIFSVYVVCYKIKGIWYILPLPCERISPYIKPIVNSAGIPCSHPLFPRDYSITWFIHLLSRVPPVSRPLLHVTCIPKASIICKLRGSTKLSQAVWNCRKMAWLEFPFQPSGRIKFHPNNSNVLAVTKPFTTHPKLDYLPCPATRPAGFFWICAERGQGFHLHFSSDITCIVEDCGKLDRARQYPFTRIRWP